MDMFVSENTDYWLGKLNKYHCQCNIFIDLWVLEEAELFIIIIIYISISVKMAPLSSWLIDTG